MKVTNISGASRRGRRAGNSKAGKEQQKKWYDIVLRSGGSQQYQMKTGEQ